MKTLILLLSMFTFGNSTLFKSREHNPLITGKHMKLNYTSYNKYDRILNWQCIELLNQVKESFQNFRSYNQSADEYKAVKLFKNYCSFSISENDTLLERLANECNPFKLIEKTKSNTINCKLAAQLFLCYKDTLFTPAVYMYYFCDIGRKQDLLKQFSSQIKQPSFHLYSMLTESLSLFKRLFVLILEKKLILT